MSDSYDICVIVPALNEAANLPLLLPRIDSALAGRKYRVVIVDDNSQDNTREVCAELAGRYPLQLIVREQPKDGLSGAVLDGIRATGARLIVVMDADLQHPPEKIPELLAPLESGQADFTIGSRYVEGGSMESSWGILRRLNSSVATLLAYPFAGRVRDPMSGFFALRRETFDGARRLTPLGYKIALELMCKARVQRVVEVPIHFGVRAHGESKLNLKQQFKYLEHLSRLYDFTFPRASPVIKFAIVTAVGWAMGLAGLTLLRNAGVWEWWGVPVSYVLTILTTLAFHIRYVRTQRDFLLNRRPWGDFAIIALIELAACAVVAYWLKYRVPDIGPLELPLMAFGIATVVRYMLRKEFLLDIRGLRRDPREIDR
jgi:dolichol-phosphate mannosyltransferase